LDAALIRGGNCCEPRFKEEVTFMKHLKTLAILAAILAATILATPAAHATTQTAGGVTCNNNYTGFPGAQLFYCYSTTQQVPVYTALSQLGADATNKLRNAQTLFYLFHDYNAYEQFCAGTGPTGLHYIPCDPGAVSQVPGGEPVDGQTFLDQRPVYSVIYEFSIVPGTSIEVGNSTLQVQKTANHEAGHQLDSLYGVATDTAFASGSRSFLTALSFDWQHLNAMTPCGFGGVFTNQVDHTSNRICNGNTLNSVYSGTNTQILQQAWPYYFTQQESPGNYRELWAEEVAVDTGYGLVGGADHYLAAFITTLAGNGTAAFGGDGLPGNFAQLHQPKGLAVDSAGNVFIADTLNNRVRRVDHATQVITTVAGSGTQGFCGDGGPATLACLYNPSGLAVDASRNLYIADTQNSRIRKVNTSGKITTIAGNGSAGYCGDTRLGDTSLPGFSQGSCGGSLWQSLYR
jgi:hypothetical protein